MLHGALTDEGEWIVRCGHAKVCTNNKSHRIQPCHHRQRVTERNNGPIRATAEQCARLASQQLLVVVVILITTPKGRWGCASLSTDFFNILTINRRKGQSKRNRRAMCGWVQASWLFAELCTFLARVQCKGDLVTVFLFSVLCEVLAPKR